MKKYGLIGHRLSHSFSKKYFNEKFAKESISCVYENFPLENIEEFTDLLNKSKLNGFNVTIPYKETIIPYLSELDITAKEIGAVNVVKVFSDGKLKGYNSDYYGFKISLQKFIPTNEYRALILGTGGASKAVAVVLKDLEIPYQHVSRTKGEGIIEYSEINEDILKRYTIIINTTPLGMYPDVVSFPDIPYHFLTDKHYLYDLVYNAEVTEFIRKGQLYGAHVTNGLDMLINQAEKAWEIWNSRN